MTAQRDDRESKESCVVAFEFEGHDFQLAPSICKFRKLNGCDTSYPYSNMSVARLIRELLMDLAVAEKKRFGEA